MPVWGKLGRLAVKAGGGAVAGSAGGPVGTVLGTLLGAWAALDLLQMGGEGVSALRGTEGKAKERERGASIYGALQGSREVLEEQDLGELMPGVERISGAFDRFDQRGGAGGMHPDVLELVREEKAALGRISTVVPPSFNEVMAMLGG